MPSHLQQIERYCILVLLFVSVIDCSLIILANSMLLAGLSHTWIVVVCFSVSPAAERIRFILGEDDSGPPPPQLFTELDELLAVDGQEMEWKETAR